MQGRKRHQEKETLATKCPRRERYCLKLEAQPLRPHSSATPETGSPPKPPG